VNKFTSVFCALMFAAGAASAQTKILFDATKAETAGSADWILDADQWNLNWNPSASTGTGTYNIHSNAQRIPIPAQSGITASTPESYWQGGLSAWGVDCAKKGYTVETLPYNGQITYGNSSNAQDLSNYKVYIVCEPNIKFTSTEKTALMLFVQNGGGLFMVSDHTVSDRNGDGWDSPAIWNDFMTSNSVASNPFGITFDLANFSGYSSNIVASSTDSIIHGTMGNVTQVQWANGTSMTLSTTANPTVKGVVFKSGTTGGGATNALVVYARYGSGKVAAIGDSSPCDDGTGNTNSSITLYNGYTGDAAGNHQRLLMNMTIWLATDGTTSTGCAAPTGLSATPVGSTSSSLAWGTVSGATGYEYAVDMTATAPTGSGTAITATSYTASSLTAGTTYYLHVRANCGGGIYSAWTTLAFNTTTASGVADATLQTATVYPNPVHDLVHVANATSATQYRITNIMGATVLKGAMVSGANTIAVDNLAKGLYLLELTGDAGQQEIIRITKD
jgi:hypothetical protein